MEKFSDTESSVREQRIDYVNVRWDQLYHLEKESGERALHYLIMTNAGGAIATLSFLGASDAALSLSAAKIALLLFIIGVLLVGVSTAKSFHYMSNLFESYIKGVNDYFSDKKSWDELYNEDVERSINDIWSYIFPYASFSCFIFGCISGSYALFSGT